MHSEWPYNNLYLFGHPRWTWVEEVGFRIHYSKILEAIERIPNVRIFLIPLSITFLNPKILGFLFLRKIA